MKEENKEPDMNFQNDEYDIPSKIEITETFLIHEESRIPENSKREMENNTLGNRGIYCTICNRQIEKYGKRKGDLKKPGWVFCPKHGWIQEGVYDRKMEMEKPVELSIEEISYEHEGEKHREREWSEISPKTETSEELSMPERAQGSAFLHKEEKPVTDLAAKVIKTRSTPIGIIVSLILLFMLLYMAFSLLGYLVWKGSSRKLPEHKSFQAFVYNEDPTADRANPGVSDSSQGSISSEKSAHETRGMLSSAGQKDLTANRQRPSSGEKNLKRLAQPQQPLAAAYTVQVGAFANISHARSLKKELYKKGYLAYISSSKTNGKDRLYKVSVGRFSNRKKADSVSNKLTETQSIHTFVTAFMK